MIVDNCTTCQFPVDDSPVWIGNQVYCGYCASNIKAASPPTTSSQFTPTFLRGVQPDCFSAIVKELDNVHTTIFVLPTGLGKTVIIAALCSHFHLMGRCMVVAHRDELIQQARKKITRFSGLECDVEMGENYADQCTLEAVAPVLVTSVQTFSIPRRMERFRPEDFSIIIIDECHHATAATYQCIVEWAKNNPLYRVVGATATPDRTDELALGQVFESVSFDYKINQAIDDGWLVPIDQQFVQVEGLDLSTVKKNPEGDLSIGQLSKILEQENILHGYAEPTIRVANGRQVIMFAASVDQAESLSNIFNRHAPGSSEWICGAEARCSKQKRRDVLEAFSKKQFQFLVNMNVLLEGYDEPNIQLVSVARPTNSRSLYTQMIGRGTRALDGILDGIESADGRKSAIAESEKPFLTVLDFVGNSGRHKLVHTGDVLGGEYDDDLIAEATRAVSSKSSRGERADMLEELRAAEERKKKRLADTARVRVQAKFKSTTIDPFGVWDIMPKREPGWFHGKKPTAKMKSMLENSKAWKEDMSFWDAHQIIDEMINRRQKGLCTFGQAKTLVKFGWSADTPFYEAKSIIDRIAASGWKLRNNS